MKSSVITAAFIGGLVGSTITYSATRLVGGSTVQSRVSVPEGYNPTRTQSPFDKPKGNEESDDYFRNLLTDPTDLTKRDSVIAKWYSNGDHTVQYLQENTGHVFGPVWNQRSPVEILEEQLVFWREHLVESTRLEEIQRAKRRAEQDADANPH